MTAAAGTGERGAPGAPGQDHSMEAETKPELHAHPEPVVTRRGLALTTLVLALVAGAWLRFAALSARPMSADEGASWAAAAASDAWQVIATQSRLNPGKLAVWDVLLHGWMRAFGEGLGTMRLPAAGLGVVAIALVFFVTAELELADARPPAQARDAHSPELAAALSALLVAVNLVTIKYSREARMYPLLLALTLAQVGFLLRAMRRGGPGNYAATAVLTALSLATHFTAAFVFATEALYLLDRLRRVGTRAADGGRLWWSGAALVAGLLLVLPAMPTAIRSAVHAVNAGAIEWISRPALWEPIALFNKATGNFGFPPMAALAAYGAYRGWRARPEAVRFALWWMWGPVLLMFAASYLLVPVFVERYALSCFVPFFILVALGILKLPTRSQRAGALALALALSLGHVRSYERKPHGVDWRSAVAMAESRLAQGEPVAVAPPYAVNVVRYYLRGSGHSVLPASGAGVADLLLIAPGQTAAGKSTVLDAQYTVVLGRARGVMLLGRPKRRGSGS